MKLCVYIVGAVKAGKSTLAQYIARKLREDVGLAHVTVDDPEHREDIQARQALRAVDVLNKHNPEVELRFIQTPIYDPDSDWFRVMGMTPGDVALLCEGMVALRIANTDPAKDAGYARMINRLNPPVPDDTYAEQG